MSGEGEGMSGEGEGMSGGNVGEHWQGRVSRTEWRDGEREREREREGERGGEREGEGFFASSIEVAGLPRKFLDVQEEDGYDVV
jgi:hypothetical protein